MLYLFSQYLIVIVSSIAWLIGWALILEYTIGGSAVARGISPNLVSRFHDKTVSYYKIYYFIDIPFSVCVCIYICVCIISLISI